MGEVYDYEAEQKAWRLKNRYSSPAKITMMEVHGALASLVHGVKEELPDYCQVEVLWRQGTYLSVIVECYAKDITRVVSQLQHGIVWGHYDYRFRMICSPAEKHDPLDWITIDASVDLSHVEKHLRKEAHHG